MTDAEADRGYERMRITLCRLGASNPGLLGWQLLLHRNNPVGFGWIETCINNNREADWFDEEDRLVFHPWRPTVERMQKGGPRT